MLTDPTQHLGEPRSGFNKEVEPLRGTGRSYVDIIQALMESLRDSR
jgi:hypothetical protein